MKRAPEPEQVKDLDDTLAQLDRQEKVLSRKLAELLRWMETNGNRS